MSLIKDLVFGEGNYVELRNVVDGHLFYDILTKTDHVIYSFSVPPEDQIGATFESRDTPKLFMRWIRKEIARREEEQKMIEQARKDWAEGKQN
jgi:hypothetical protein